HGAAGRVWSQRWRPGNSERVRRPRHGNRDLRVAAQLRGGREARPPRSRDRRGEPALDRIPRFRDSRLLAFAIAEENWNDAGDQPWRSLRLDSRQVYRGDT